VIAELFLALALAGSILTLNAHFPPRRVAMLGFPSFVAGWLWSELPGHHLLLQVLVSAGFTAAGALERWPGQLAMLLTLLSWLGLLWAWARSRSAGPEAESALQEALGPDYAQAIDEEAARAQPPARHLLMPWLRRDPKVTLHRNIRYAEGEGSRHLLDIYTPKAGARAAPVLLQIHGGGWFTGHKRQQAVPLLLHMARLGWVCVSINYRLSPRATFPDHLVDAKLALRFIRERIADYGGDANFVAVTGGSAGGHLAAMVGLTAGDPEYQPGFEEVDTAVCACVPLYGVYDFTNRLGHPSAATIHGLVSRWVLKSRVSEDPERFERASPLYRIEGQLPPFFVIHGTHDTLVHVDEARSFVAKLRSHAEKPVAYAEIEGAHHAFEIFHSTRTAHVVAAIGRFLSWTYAQRA